MPEPERFSFLVGGEAGHGVRSSGGVVADFAGELGRYVFQTIDYQSLIRGGHNFSIVTTSLHPVFSQYLNADLVVALDRRSYDLHREHLAPGGLMVYNSDVVADGSQGEVGVPLGTLAREQGQTPLRYGVGAVAIFLAATGTGREDAEDFIRRKYPRDSDSNVAYGLAVFDAAHHHVAGRYSLTRGKAPSTMLTGNEAVGLGAYAGGLDMYFAYPMTPSSSLLHFLAAHAAELGIVVMHPESEIAVMNMAIGAASVGVRAAVGSSGGGMALMEEGMSLAGMAEAPVLCVLSSRPGPSTGVPTYTAQQDLFFALNQGHGEFVRVVASPGTVAEAYELAAELLGLAWAFQMPAILLTEKHLSESRMTVELPDISTIIPVTSMWEGDGEYRRYAETADGVSPLAFAPSDSIIKWSSYEHDEAGITTEDANTIVRMQEKRLRKGASLISSVRHMRSVNRFGNGDVTIVTYGSTAMSVREAIAFGALDVTILQLVYLEPFPEWEFEKLAGREVIVVEQSCGGQLAALLQRRTRVTVKAVVTQYDGRPFDPEVLASRLKEVLGHG